MLQQQTQAISGPAHQTELETCATPGHLEAETDAQATAVAVEELLAALAVEQHKRKRLTLRFRVGLGFALGIVCILIMVIAVKTEKWMVLSSLACLTALGASVAASNRQKQTLASLAQFDDLRAVGPLAEALEYGDEEILPIAEKALIRLLPLLKANDTEKLNTEQRQCLHHVLNKAYNTRTELAIAILKALEQVGDERDLATVQRLAKGGGRAAKEQVVRQAAEACLPYLQQRAGEQTVRQSLLRAASLTDIPSDLLLRPAIGGETHDPLELLRACPHDGRTMTDAETLPD